MRILLKPPKEFDSYTVNDVAFSPDGTLLAAAIGRGEGPSRWSGQVLVWTLGVDQPPRVVHECRNTSRHVAFSPDGQHLAATSGDRSIRVFTVVDFVEIARFEGHTRAIFAMAFSPSGKELVTCSGASEQPGETIHWKFPSGQMRLNHPSPDGCLAIAFSSANRPGDKALALATNGVEICDRDGTQSARLNHKNRVREMVFSPDGKFLATVTGKELRWWDLAAGKSKILSKVGGFRLALAPDHRHLAWGGEDRTVHIWDLHEGREKVAYQWSVGMIHSLAFSPQGMSAATGGNSTRNNSLVLWDIDWK